MRKNDSALLEQGRRIHALHEIISRPDLNFDQQIDETLRLGCKILGTEVGKLGRQDPEHNISEFLNTIVLSDLPAKRGIQLPLDKTFCQVTFSSPETIAISHVAESDYRNHPAAAFLGMQSYIGCSINVHGKKFGTVNFSNKQPVAIPFTESDKDFVNLIGSWISVMMERQLEAIELKKAKESAEKANHAKSVFLANMSHEIRTPLTAIIGFADAVLDDEQTAEERSAALKIIHSSSNHLLNLINDVLDISKIESGELNIDKTDVDIRQLISEVESMISGHASQKGLTLSVEYNYPYPQKIATDALRLKQILLNLCNNAIKFTNHGSVKIIVKYNADKNVLDIMVKDTGIGLTSEQMGKIFTPFIQAESSISKNYGGTGLGLSLSRRLAEMLGGELNVSSKHGEGSVFTLTHKFNKKESDMFSLVTDANKGITKQATYEEQIPKLTGNILLADDSEMNQYLFEIYINKTGASVDMVENGELAVDCAQSKKYDLILMDMMMPVMSGIDAVKKIRTMNKTIPIVMLTASVTLKDKSECEEVGSTEYFTKPVDKNKFYLMLAKYLKSDK